jgi:carbamoyltransferase
MDPSIPDGKDILNDKVKEREWYRPFGASILEEEVSNYFDWNDKSEYMLYTMDVIEPDRFPAITHVDGTCRTQTVGSSLYYQLISNFKDLTGIPMVLNTSLNMGGKPIAGTPADAIDLLHASDMDALVIGNRIYE